MLFRVLLLAAVVVLMSACRSTPTPSQDTESGGTRISLLEEKLLEVIDAEQDLDALAAEEDPDRMEVQRRFHQLAREYQGIIARNPDHLESRLLYGKLLSRYGDREGARDQFLIAAQIDSQIAVIHQQLSTYFAEEGDPTRALAYALNAVRIEPETAAYHFGLGQLLVAFRDEFLKEAVFSESQIDEELLTAFRTAAELEPDTLPLQFRYGEAFYDVADPDWQAALAQWQSVAARDDLSPLQVDAVRIHRARCLTALGREDEAQAMIDAVQSPELKDSAQAILDSPDGNP
jgi:tetratricopeptide (TPR) repeat protein